MKPYETLRDDVRKSKRLAPLPDGLDSTDLPSVSNDLPFDNQTMFRGHGASIRLDQSNLSTRESMDFSPFDAGGALDVWGLHYTVRVFEFGRHSSFVHRANLFPIAIRNNRI